MHCRNIEMLQGNRKHFGPFRIAHLVTVGLLEQQLLQQPWKLGPAAAAAAAVRFGAAAAVSHCSPPDPP